MSFTRVAAGLALVIALCACAATARPSGLTRISLNGGNASGSVAFEGNPWQGYFVPETGGQVTISPYITGDNDDKSISVFIGMGYEPDGDTHDWQANAIGTGTYEFWYPVTINYVFPNTTYYVTVVDEIILPADFTFSTQFQPMPPPRVPALQVGGLPTPGRVDEGQYAYYTATPNSEGNVTVKLQVTDGAATVIGNLGSYATLGNSQWSAQCDSKSSPTCSFQALYIRAGQTLYVTVWGREGRNIGDDDVDQPVDRFYLSATTSG